MQKTNKNHISNNNKSVGKNNPICLNHVGENCVFPHSKGITLIALIITIIVMIILVGVTISVALNGGLFETTRQAAKDTQIEADREVLQAGVAGAMVSDTGITNESLTSNLPEGWEVGIIEPYTVISLNKNQFLVTSNGEIEYKELVEDDLTRLQEYFLGKNLIDVVVDTGFNEFIDNDIIPDASTSIQFKAALPYDEIGALIIQYNSKIYMVAISMKDTQIKSVELMYEQNGKEGKTVLYSYDGAKENEKEWLVLYDDGEYLEIVSPEIMGSLTLGANDENAKGTTDTEKALDSYNNAITRINNYCASLITNENKVSVRSLGSNPYNPNSENSTKYTTDSNMFKNYYTQYTIESGDINCIYDLSAQFGLNKVPLFNEECWLASREKPEIVSDGHIAIYTSNNSGLGRQKYT